MKKLHKWLIGLIPQSIIIFYMRRLKIIKASVYDPKLKIKIASTKDELLAAYQLLYEAYVSSGLMDENEFKLRCNLYTFLPTTVTIIACIDDEVVGTVAAIRDSTFGLPSDKEFLKQNDQLRGQEGVLAEISALAVKKNFRYSDHRVSYLLMKFVYRFCIDYFKCTNAVIVVHPKTENFYKAYLAFEKNGPTIRYDFVKGALGIHMNSNLRYEAQKFYIKQSYNCFAQFIYESDSNCLFPVFKDGQIVIPVMNQRKFLEFLQLAGLRISNFKQNEMIALISLYKPKLQIETNQFLMKNLREFRYPLEKNAILRIDGVDTIVRINNISVTGVFIQTHLELNKEGQKVEFIFELNSKIYCLKSQFVWSNENKKSTYLPKGIGLKFDQHFYQLNQEIQGWALVS